MPSDVLLVWDENARQDYLWWQQQDRKILDRITLLLKDITRNGNEGLGKPEPLKYDVAGYWSRRITDEHRLVCRVTHTVKRPGFDGDIDCPEGSKSTRAHSTAIRSPTEARIRSPTEAPRACSAPQVPATDPNCSRTVLAERRAEP